MVGMRKGIFTSIGIWSFKDLPRLRGRDRVPCMNSSMALLKVGNLKAHHTGGEERVQRKKGS